jgi:peptidoglycan/LPS O-acetylase OafA/YrhL
VLFEHGVPVLTLYIRTSTRADSLLVGALLAALWTQRRTPTRGVAAAGWIGLACYGWIVVRGASDAFLYRGGYTLIAVMIAAVILASLESSWAMNRVLTLPGLRLVGRVSYGLYIWHLGIFLAIQHYGSSWSMWTRLALGLSLTAAAATASFIFVERPFLRWKQRLEGAGAPTNADQRGTGAVVPAMT